LYGAVIERAEGIKTLRWTEPDTGVERVESPSLLAARVLHELGVREGEISSAGINGMHYWTIDGDKSLHQLAMENGMRNTGARRIDRDALRAVLKEIPPGHWTTYGDVAEGIGSPGAAQSVASAIASDTAVENAHRVLRANGAISPEWAGTDGSGPEEVRKKLEAEGVEFGDGECADPKSHWQPPVPAG